MVCWSVNFGGFISCCLMMFFLVLSFWCFFSFGFGEAGHGKGKEETHSIRSQLSQKRKIRLQRYSRRLARQHLGLEDLAHDTSPAKRCEPIDAFNSPRRGEIIPAALPRGKVGGIVGWAW